MANKNFEIKNGLTVAGTERITAAGAGSLTNLTLSGNLTVQGTTVTLDASTLQVADKNIVLNYHASNDTSSASSGAGITIQDAVNGTTDATILWDASDDEFDFSHAINIPNLKVSGAQGTDGQLLTSTGSGIAWEDAPASGPTFKTFGTSSIMIGDSTTGTINAADYNTGLGIDVFANLTTGDKNTVVGFEAGNALTVHNQNTLIGYQAGKLLGGSSESWEAQRNVFIGYGAGLNVDEGQRAIAIGYYAMMSSLATTTNDIAIGYQAMQYRSSNTGDSIAIGYNAHRGDINEGYQNANRNVAVGTNTLSIIETGGMQNTAIGWYAGQNATTGPYNTLIGSEAGQAVSTGQKNTLLGYRAGELITTGSYNVVIGSYDGNEGGLDIRTATNRIVISDGLGNIRLYADNAGRVGIGTTSPQETLHLFNSAQTWNQYSNIRMSTESDTYAAEIGFHRGTSDDSDRGLFLSGDGTNKHVRVLHGGNVGIGQIAPATTLHIGDGASHYVRIENAASGDVSSGYQIYRGSSVGMSLYDNPADNMTSLLCAGGLNINAGGSGTDLHVTSNGKVGIGTTSPQTSAKGLHVVHDATEGTPSFPSGEVIIAQRNFNSSQGCHIGIIGGSASDSAINFGDKDNSDAGIIRYHHNGDFLGFTTNTTEHWKMFANGSFQPTQQHTKDIGGVNAEVRNIYAQGLYVGGSAAANKLDDYEEGTWTPVLQNVTTSSISFYSLYTKIGRICHIHCKITATVASLPGANFAISGLPFSAKDSGDTQQRALIAIGGDSQNLGSYANGRAHFRTNGSQLQGVWLNSGSTAYWNYNSMDHTTFEIHLHGQYTV